ncbi:LysR family transcriptional regulator [Paraburkholderia terricola]|uniref:LysR family transcriptional regulator, regulatory protein for tcuABC n=1 Tax=Paraburkholderia terricola TaxID=169427 RepID=A0A1M6T4D0_9BURK|nr:MULTISPECIES: LysR substrate-binding domain-containing protein [Paraburkholderia]SDO70243.1 LysR family transcriptional regulator, regulatory protein for tcuABC [Paraburkholderia sediminicola]SHK51749.1 LysR family transcriptional regulator, regulatory protein for tcuABC [Paraburkholderia terricola]
MELRQLRYFVRIVECGSMGRAAIELDVVTSTLSQQISRLESELSVRLLQRTKTGIQPTEAGLAFWHRAQLVLRHADDAARVAKAGRLAGQVAVGFAPSTSGVVALPFMRAMRERYPDISLRVVESLSGNLESMLVARQIDLAILFGSATGKRLSTVPLLDERLFAISAARSDLPANAKGLSIRELAAFPLIVPSGNHGLRVLINAAFAKANCQINLAAEIDGLATLMEAVGSGLGATIQPGAALARCDATAFRIVPVHSAYLTRLNQLASLSDDELSPAGLAARVVLKSVTRELVSAGKWAGAKLVSDDS